jgi:transposase
MGAKRRRFAAEFKARVALAAMRGDRTINQVASQYEVHPHQVSAWKKELEAAAREFFADRRRRGKAREEVDAGPLYEEIGRLKMELDWLKKKVGYPE